MTRRRGGTTLAATGRPRLRWRTREAEQWFDAQLRVWCDDANVLAIIAVGSAIRDVDRPADADFVVIWEGEKPVLGQPPIEVDIRSYERSKAEALIARGNDYLQWAVRLGQPVFERGNFWTDFRRRWAQRAPWPDAAESDERAERAARYKRELAAAGDRDAASEQLVSELTHRARAALLRARVFPASRPELPGQLRQIGESALADECERALAERWA